MKIKLMRGSVININKNNKEKDLQGNNLIKMPRNSLKLNFMNKANVLFIIRDKLIKTYLEKQKKFEKEVGNIIKRNKNNYSIQAKINYYKMFITNLTSEKSRRIRLKYTERLIEIDDHEILKKYYRKHECYMKLRLIIHINGENLIIFPKYQVNEVFCSIMEKYIRLKEKIILRTEKNNRLNEINFQLIKGKRINKNKEISDKLIESFMEDNEINIDLENNLKNLNDENSSKSLIDKSNSSIKFKNLINNLNNNVKVKKEKPKKYIRFKTKILEIANKIINKNDKIKLKRFNSDSKPISFNEKKIIQKLYFNNFLFKTNSENEEKIGKKKMKNNKLRYKKLYLETSINQKNNNNINLLNINSYDFKSRFQDRKIILNFKPTELFIYNYFKEKNLERKKQVKNTIIRTIKEYEALKNLNIISLLNSKNRDLINNNNLSFPKKRTNKICFQKRGFTTEITNFSDIINRQKLKEEKSSRFNDKENKDLDILPSIGLFYNKNNSNFINSKSMSERIKLNTKKTLKNKKYKNIFSFIDNKI